MQQCYVQTRFFQDHGPESAEECKRLWDLPSETYPTKLLYVYDKTNVFRKYECPRVFLEERDEKGYPKKDQKFVSNPWGNGENPFVFCI